ncbi:MAG: DUF456 domain-containing protein [Psychroflexus sp.]|nr:DUF456 domain-containing protein [Psychroflexus sp.]MDN6309040.1 DUF456 domain-containing protein [Psychroflexus sp.]
MSILLISLGFVFCILGVLGSFLPVLPGPPVSWLGLLLFYLAPAIPMDYVILSVTFVIALAVFVLDYIVPVIGTKSYGGSQYGIIGTTVGLVVGIVAPIPFGFLIGPFVGAFVGEFFFNKSQSKTAFRAAYGSFLGFLGSTLMKFVFSLAFTAYYVYKLIDYRDLIF